MICNVNKYYEYLFTRVLLENINIKAIKRLMSRHNKYFKRFNRFYKKIYIYIMVR